ncbi:hypothetical protein FRB99_005756 [Tulasnella sp. 403]|nr:hypothetical protein FRB99_005756 [Tulasnella sp. 403]
MHNTIVSAPFPEQQATGSLEDEAIAEAEKEVVSLEVEIELAVSIFLKIAGLAWHVHDSSILHIKFEQYIKEANSNLECLTVHVFFKSQVKQLIAKHDKLQLYELTTWQWDLAVEVMLVLKIFKEPTELFSQVKVPLIYQVVPLMKSLDFCLYDMILECHRPL